RRRVDREIDELVLWLEDAQATAVRRFDATRSADQIGCRHHGAESDAGAKMQLQRRLPFTAKLQMMVVTARVGGGRTRVGGPPRLFERTNRPLEIRFRHQQIEI